MTQRQIEVATSDGIASAHLFGDAGATAGVILYMDAFGPRAALFGMAERLADEGYAVLVPDLFYRFGTYGPFDAATAFSTPETATQLRSMIGGTTQAMTAEDTGFFLAALRQAGATGPIAVVGYCMGGSRALTAAGTYPDDIVAAASFHGGNLASEAPDSPHLLADRMRARVYVGTAGVDGSFPLEQSNRFVDAFRRAEVDFVLENYVGMAHGWCVPDHSVYEVNGAERHWRRLTALLAETLKAG